MSKTDLLSIIGTENSERQADIIFIHGLGGDARSTWHPQQKKDDDDLWLMWLGKDLEDVGIWSLAYEVEPAKRMYLWCFWNGRCRKNFSC